jgi:hypothetical protein
MNSLENVMFGIKPRFFTPTQTIEGQDTFNNGEGIETFGKTQPLIAYPSYGSCI